MLPNRYLLAFCLLCACAHDPVPDSDGGTSPVSRIVVLGPSTAANLFALGQGERIVGVSDYCTVEAAQGIARVGGLADPSLERIVALHPDLVLVQGKAPRIEELCRTTGIELQEFATDTLEEWYAEVEWLTTRLDLKEEGARMQDSMRIGLEEMAAPPVGQAPSVLLVIFRRDGEASGMTVAGDTGFLDELLSAAGGSNVLSGSGQDYFALNEERLIRAAPDWILEFHTEQVDAATRERLDAEAIRIWSRDFPSLPAVRAGNIRTLVGKDLLIPGPDMLQTSREIRSALHAGK